MTDPLPALDAITEILDAARDRGPAPETHEVCTLSVAWARHHGVTDGNLHALADEFRTMAIRFFDWDRHPVYLRDGTLGRPGEDGPGRATRCDAQWDGEHLAIRTPVAPGVMISHGSIRIETEMPLSMMAALVGRPLSDLIATPFPVDAAIASVRMEEGLVVEVEPRWTAVRA